MKALAVSSKKDDTSPPATGGKALKQAKTSRVLVQKFSAEIANAEQDLAYLFRSIWHRRAVGLRLNRFHKNSCAIAICFSIGQDVHSRLPISAERA